MKVWPKTGRRQTKSHREGRGTAQWSGRNADFEPEDIPPEKPSWEHPPKGSDQSQEIDYLRAGILQNVLVVTLVLGIVAYLVNLPRLLQSAQWGVLSVYSLVLIGAMVVTFIRRIPYTVRATVFLVLIYVLGLSALLDTGLNGSGRVFLVVLPVFASLLAGLRGRVSALVISIASVFLVGLLMSSGRIPLPNLPPDAGNSSLSIWGIALASFVLISVTATVSLNTLMRGLENSLDKQSELAIELEEEHTQFQAHIQQSTQTLQRRLIQIRTAAEITRYISSILDIHLLLPQVCDLIQDRFDLYYVGVFLIEEEDRIAGDFAPTPYAVLTAGTGDAGQRMLAAGHRLAVGGDSMIGWATSHRQARIALDVGQEAVHFANPHLPKTRSELALPILAGDNVLGALTIQSTKSSAFDDDDITVLQGMANSLGSAINNARLFTELQTSLDEIQTLHRQYLARSWTDVMATQGAMDYTFQAERDLQAGAMRTVEVPLKLREQVIGKLTLEAETDSDDVTGSQEWTPEELTLIETVTNQAALALENARLLNETQRQAEQERITTELTGKIWSVADIDNILQTTLQELGRALGVSDGMIQLEMDD